MPSQVEGKSWVSTSDSTAPAIYDNEQGEQSGEAKGCSARQRAFPLQKPSEDCTEQEQAEQAGKPQEPQRGEERAECGGGHDHDHGIEPVRPKRRRLTWCHDEDEGELELLRLPQRPRSAVRSAVSPNPRSSHVCA
jgi:hypothetical protein